MLSSDFHNILYFLNSFAFQWPLEFWEELEAPGRVSRVSTASVDGKQHLSEVIFSEIVGFL